MAASLIADNVKRVQERIADACAQAARDPSEITLVAVSKRKPAEDILAALAAGVQHFGENRVEEAEIKIPQVHSALAQQADVAPPVWHMIGHIQSRKSKHVPPLFRVVHSVDSVKLARQLSALGGAPLDVFVQVNVSGEPQKYGFEGYGWQRDVQRYEALCAAFGELLRLPTLRVRGLMTMAPFDAPEPELRSVFASLAQLREALAKQFDVSLPDLSMGMTDDYPSAILEGATVIRVGRAIFGERDND